MSRLKEKLRAFALRTKKGKKAWDLLSKINKFVLNDTKTTRLPKSMSINQFFDALNSRKCRYVLLRWFDELNEDQTSRDLDILVHDDDIEIIEGLLIRSSRKGGLPCDVYSVSGMPNYSHKGVPYYPPAIAELILARSVKHQTGACIPSLEEYFYSLAFHAIYHKGYKSGMPISETEPSKWRSPKHDYHRVLSNLAIELGFDINISMTSIETLLEEKGWCPTLEMLEVFSRGNEWCEKLYANKKYIAATEV